MLFQEQGAWEPGHTWALSKQNQDLGALTLGMKYLGVWGEVARGERGDVGYTGCSVRICLQLFSLSSGVMFQDPQHMPETKESAKPYGYRVFLCIHTSALKGSTSLLVFGMSESLASLLVHFGAVIK